MTFPERYTQETTWHGKVLVMGIFHIIAVQKDPKWTITDTAREFGVSNGLVSENLRLAHAIDKNVQLLQCKSRTEALTVTSK